MSEAVKEKKVEYLELIYDLIFVYIIGRNNMLLHHTEGGFVPAGLFIAYILCSLAVIQIWNYSTFYENLYGRNSIRDHDLCEKTLRFRAKICSFPVVDISLLYCAHACFQRKNAD